MTRMVVIDSEPIQVNLQVAPFPLASPSARSTPPKPDTVSAATSPIQISLSPPPQPEARASPVSVVMPLFLVCSCALLCA